MKIIRYLTVFGGLVILALAIGFILQIPLATSLWPWPDGRLSYLFIGSILAAVSAAALWIGWSGEFGALPAGSLNVLVIAVTTSIYFFQLAMQKDRPNMMPFGVMALFMAIVSVIAFLWSRRLPLQDSRPMPLLVKISFGIFIASLIFAGSALILHTPIFPWALNPDSSVIFGCIFIGDAFYFLYSLLYPRWHNALGQLLSFLAYDLVLIVPFLLLFKTVKPEYMVSLIVYVAVLIYSGGLAVYFLFVNSQTRLRGIA
jgi:hypothetical protein